MLSIRCWQTPKVTSRVKLLAQEMKQEYNLALMANTQIFLFGLGGSPKASVSSLEVLSTIGSKSTYIGVALKSHIYSDIVTKGANGHGIFLPDT
jgi:hypothetical protein